MSSKAARVFRGLIMGKNYLIDHNVEINTNKLKVHLEVEKVQSQKES